MKQEQSSSKQETLTPASAAKILKEATKLFEGKAKRGNDFVLRFAPTHDGFSTIAPFVDEVLQNEDPSFVAMVQVLLDELCSNVVFYSGAKEGAYLLLRLEKDCLTMAIMDDGVAFDATKRNVAPDPDKPGGLGINLVRDMSDAMDYERVDGHNVIVIKKNK